MKKKLLYIEESKKREDGGKKCRKWKISNKTAKMFYCNNNWNTYKRETPESLFLTVTKMIDPLVISTLQNNLPKSQEDRSVDLWVNNLVYKPKKNIFRVGVLTDSNRSIYFHY